MNGDVISLLSKLFQEKPLNHGWSLTSWLPLNPSLLPGLRWSSYFCKDYLNTLLMKSAASSEKPSGNSFFLMETCLAMICSLISCLDLPE
jgi:hypothetical protein